MSSGGTVPSSDNMLFYSIQRTYIIKPVFMPDKLIFTCDERIDIPTIEPLTYVDPVVYPGHRPNVVPCIEITATHMDLDGINLTFETNEGVTVLPVKIASGTQNPLKNPYLDNRYVLVLPRGTTGIKTCKLVVPEIGEEFQHNFTFGIMPPPYNYDNALFGVITLAVDALENKVKNLRLTTKTPDFASIELPKGAGKQTINIEDGVLFYDTVFIYPPSSNPTRHNPKITLHGSDGDTDYTLLLEGIQTVVSIDLLAGMITAYDGYTGNILKQIKLYVPYNGFKTLSFENFDDINLPALLVEARGARVK